MIYEVIDHRYDFDLNIGIWGDFSIKLATHKSKKLYAEPIRMVTYHDSKKTGNDVEFITNNFMIGALEVTNLYRQVGYWGFLQVDKSEYCIEDLVWIF